MGTEEDVSQVKRKTQNAQQLSVTNLLSQGLHRFKLNMKSLFLDPVWLIWDQGSQHHFDDNQHVLHTQVQVARETGTV